MVSGRRWRVAEPDASPTGHQIQPPQPVVLAIQRGKLLTPAERALIPEATVFRGDWIEDNGQVWVADESGVTLGTHSAPASRPPSPSEETRAQAGSSPGAVPI